MPGSHVIFLCSFTETNINFDYITLNLTRDVQISSKDEAMESERAKSALEKGGVVDESASPTHTWKVCRDEEALTAHTEESAHQTGHTPVCPEPSRATLAPPLPRPTTSRKKFNTRNFPKDFPFNTIIVELEPSCYPNIFNPRETGIGRPQNGFIGPRGRTFVNRRLDFQCSALVSVTGF